MAVLTSNTAVPKPGGAAAQERAEIVVSSRALRDAAHRLGAAGQTLDACAAELERLAGERGEGPLCRFRCRRAARALRALAEEYRTRRLLLLLSDQRRAAAQGRAYLLAKQERDGGKAL